MSPQVKAEEKNTIEPCVYCQGKSEYCCKIAKVNLCENCREHHLHVIQEQILIAA